MENFQDERILCLPEGYSSELFCKIKIPLKRSVIYYYETWLGVSKMAQGSHFYQLHYKYKTRTGVLI